MATKTASATKTKPASKESCCKTGSKKTGSETDSQ